MANIGILKKSDPIVHRPPLGGLKDLKSGRTKI